MGYSEAFNRKSELISWYRTPRAKEFMGRFVESTENRNRVKMPDDPETFRRRQEAQLLSSETYWVSQEMTDFVYAASLSMPHQPLLETDLSTASGFVYFDQVIEFSDAVGNTVRIRAAMWAPMESAGVHVTLFSDLDHDAAKENISPAARHGLPKVLLLHHGTWKFEESMTQIRHRGERIRADYPGASIDQILESELFIRKFMAAFWVICQQPITSFKTERVQRKAEKRAKKANTIKKPDVLVVTLRRFKTDPDHESEPTSVNWSHRWMVGFFWRKQWYPSIGAHRVIPILPYIKGPKDKPLVIKKRVYALKR